MAIGISESFVAKTLLFAFNSVRKENPHNSVGYTQHWRLGCNTTQHARSTVHVHVHVGTSRPTEPTEPTEANIRMRGRGAEPNYHTTILAFIFLQRAGVAPRRLQITPSLVSSTGVCGVKNRGGGEAVLGRELEVRRCVSGIAKVGEVA